MTPTGLTAAAFPAEEQEYWGTPKQPFSGLEAGAGIGTEFQLFGYMHLRSGPSEPPLTFSIVNSLFAHGIDFPGVLFFP